MRINIFNFSTFKDLKDSKRYPTKLQISYFTDLWNILIYCHRFMFKIKRIFLKITRSMESASIFGINKWFSASDTLQGNWRIKSIDIGRCRLYEKLGLAVFHPRYSHHFPRETWKIANAARCLWNDLFCHATWNGRTPNSDAVSVKLCNSTLFGLDC